MNIKFLILNRPVSFLKYIIFSLFLAAGLAFNIIWGRYITLGAGFTIAYFVFLGLYLGQHFWPAEKFISKLLLGILALISSAAVLLSLAYYFYELNNYVIAAFVAAAPLIIGALIKIFPQKTAPAPAPAEDSSKHIVRPKIGFGFFFLNVFYIFLAVMMFFILAKSRTGESLVSPWQAVPINFFTIYFLFIFFSFILLATKWKENYTLLILFTATFANLGVALLVYKFGYGFDSFIHRASENFIAQTGAITPKSPFYIGQYVIVVSLAKMLAVGTGWVDKLLLPIFVAIYLPLAGYFSLSRIFDRRVAPFLALLPLLLFPTDLIVTTPYGLSLVFLLITIFLGINYLLRGKPLFVIIALLALTTFFVHPIVGIPAVVFALLILIFRHAARHPAVLGLAGGPMTILAGAAVPLSLIALSKLGWSVPIIWRFGWQEKLPSLFLRFNFILDFVYLYKTYFLVFVVVLAIFGLFAARRQKSTLVALSGILMSLGLYGGYLIMKNFAVFPLLAPEENQNYALRLRDVSYIFLLIPAFFSLSAIFSNLKTAPKKFHLAFFLLLAVIFSSALYLTYPRRDIYDNNHGWSVGANHLAAAEYIENDADGAPYIVLADQTTGAAALDKFGFNNFKNGVKRHVLSEGGETFYYPIPLGGKLYEDYLKIIYAGGGPEILEEAESYARVQKSYLVLNDYWDNYAEVKARFLASGAALHDIGGKITIIKIK